MVRLRGAQFRANEAAASGRERVVHYYSRYLKEASQREEAILFIDSLIAKYGPPVEGYPSWHPFIFSPRIDSSGSPETDPQDIEGLDHTIYFRDAFVTAPYGDAQRVVESALKKNSQEVYAEIDAEVITDVVLYNQGVTPILVTCAGIPRERDATILKRFALGSMLATELPGWRWASCGESWDDMRRYILGTPCGSRSSLFVNQDTGQALREVYELLNQHELFGPARS